MSVYTTVDSRQLEGLLQEYSVGELKGFRGIEAGIENTNYFVSTSAGEYVLTIFEHATVEELQFDLQLMEHLATHDIPCPLPLHRNDGELLSNLCHKPTALVSQLQGHSPEVITTGHCREIGQWLARLHLAGEDFALTRPTPRDLSWAEQTLNELKPRISHQHYQLIASELEFQGSVPRQQLPQGIIHSDLFCDNVLFTAGHLSGLLDLYDASVDAWLYDVAVTANAWCSREQGDFDRDKLQALLLAYGQIRPLTDAERHYWPAMCRAAALRFWLSRLHHREFHRPGDLTQVKQPEVYEKILLQRHREPSLTRQTCG